MYTAQLLQSVRVSLLGALVVLAGVAVFINIPQKAEANGIQQLVQIGLGLNGINPVLFVASPQHDSTVSSNTVQYSARYSWIDCANEPGTAFIKLYEHVAGGKVSSIGGGEESSEWKLLAQDSAPLNTEACPDCGGQTPKELTITGTFTLDSLNTCGATTLWTTAGSKGWKHGNIIHDFTWVNRVDCTTPTPTPTPVITPAPQDDEGITCADGSQIIVTSTNSNVNCNNNVITLNVDNSSNNNNSSSNSSKSESKNENNHSGNVSVVQNTNQSAPVVAHHPAPQVAGIAAVSHATPQIFHVPVTAKTGSTDIATLLLSTLSGGSGLAYVIRRTLIG